MGEAETEEMTGALWFWDVPTNDWVVEGGTWHHFVVAGTGIGRLRVYVDGTRYVPLRKK
jgi:hypothetical protein